VTLDDLCYEPTTSLARRIRAGEVSPLDAVHAYLERIERADARLHAYLHVAPSTRSRRRGAPSRRSRRAASSARCTASRSR
jgi:Asp-tRNA(Asn)/Glu-tRNA(Gln) amidotransferase A subunit family amidase